MNEILIQIGDKFVNSNEILYVKPVESAPVRYDGEVRYYRIVFKGSLSIDVTEKDWATAALYYSRLVNFMSKDEREKLCRMRDE